MSTSIVAPFPGEAARQLTRRAQLDASLAAGQVPERFDLDGIAAEEGHLDGELLLADIQRIGIGRQDSLHNEHVLFGVQTFAKAVCGGMAGLFVTAVVGVTAPLSMAVLIGAGAVAGAGLSLWQFHQHDQGKVRIDHNGEPRQTRFQIWQNDFSRTPAELRTELYARGVLGDTIQPAAAPAVSAEPTAELQQLDADRRLVADLGHRSRYGHAVLDLIDAPTAAGRLAKGEGIFVVDGQPAIDRPVSLVVRAASPDGNKRHDEDLEYVERNFNYHLSPIGKTADLAAVASARGLPDGMMGVYRFNDHIEQTVYETAQERTSTQEPKSLVHQERAREVVHADDVVPQPATPPPTWMRRTLNWTKLTTFLGVGAGVVTATALGVQGGPAWAFLLAGGALGAGAGHLVNNSRFGGWVPEGS